MLDEKDLQAISRLMRDMEDRLDAKMEARLADTKQSLQQEIAETRQSLQQEIRKEIAGAKREIMMDAHVLMEQEFRPQFNLLAEGQQIILEKIKPVDDIEALEIRVSALEAMVKKISREIAMLKGAQ